MENIPGTALAEGMKWRWETFPEYMNFLSTLQCASDFSVMIGHVPLRLYVMGKERCHDKPERKDLVKMRHLVAEAIRAGALGISTSRTLLHRDLQGVVIPGSYAGRAELCALMSGLSDGGGGLFEILDDFADLKIEMEWIGAVCKAFRCKVSIALGVGDAKARKVLLNWMTEVNREVGVDLISAQSAIRRQGCLQSLDSQYHPFVGHPIFQKELAGLPLKQRMKKMRKPEMKRRILEIDNQLWGKPFAAVIWNPENLYFMCNHHGVPTYERYKSENVASIAEQKDVSPYSIIYDHLSQGGVLWAPLTGLRQTFSEENPMLDEMVDIITKPHVHIGLGDGGAHLQIFQEASCPTFAVAHYSRDRTHGPKIPLERVVKMLSSDTANLVGMHDRGKLHVGMRADINIIDFKRLKVCEPYIANDLPTGAKRWVQRAEGYVMTLCKGVVTYENGTFTGNLPGRLVKSPLRDKLDVRTVEQIGSVLLSMIPEPRSTHDTLVRDADLKGGASATVRALNKNMADLVSAAGDFFSGKMVKGVSKL